LKIAFPSREFDDAVAAVCNGLVSEEQARALNETLRSDPAARDEYILRVELHSRLAADPDLFASASADAPLPVDFSPRGKTAWALGLAACAAIIAIVLWRPAPAPAPKEKPAISKAVAMLNRTVEAHWMAGTEPARLGAPLEPGWLRLESGLAQIVFYSGARVVIEGPAEFQLISANDASCRRGRVLADIPPQARGFRIATPQTSMTDLGTSVGLSVNESRTELHVFAGSVRSQNGLVRQGSAAVVESSGIVRQMAANAKEFSSLLDVREKSVAAEAERYEQWRAASSRIDSDPSLIVHFDFERLMPSGWQLPNSAVNRAVDSDAVIVGCQRGAGRWPGKRSLEFQSVSDRVRLNVPGEFESMTLTAWICVKGLDRKVNSLFMCDGFRPGTVHWLLLNDGVSGLTVIGANPGHHQIVTGPPILPLDKFGIWLHLAVALDGQGRRVVQYLNGVPIDDQSLRIAPPFRIGPAELGNWNAKGFPEDDPFMIRNFSGAIDEFCLFNRALDAEEIRALYAQGKPQGGALAGALNEF
jgi:hypothetical protein